MSSLEQVACEDLKAFERRLTEIIASAGPSAFRWRVILATSSLCVAIGAFYWISDPATAEVAFISSILNHTFFTTSTVTLLILLMMGAHRRVVAPSIFASRTREVLFDFAMDCDETGKLILKPRPASA